MAAQWFLSRWIAMEISCLSASTAMQPVGICSSSRQGHGKWEEPYEDCAAREIREETGMEAGRLQKVGEFYLAPGYSSEFMAVFLATDLKHNPLDADDDEFLQVEKIPVKDVTAMFERGDVPDSKSLAAWLLAKPYLEQYSWLNP